MLHHADSQFMFDPLNSYILLYPHLTYYMYFSLAEFFLYPYYSTMVFTFWKEIF